MPEKPHSHDAETTTADRGRPRATSEAQGVPVVSRRGSNVAAAGLIALGVGGFLVAVYLSSLVLLAVGVAIVTVGVMMINAPTPTRPRAWCAQVTRGIPLSAYAAGAWLCGLAAFQPHLLNSSLGGGAVLTIAGVGLIALDFAGSGSQLESWFRQFGSINDDEHPRPSLYHDGWSQDRRNRGAVLRHHSSGHRLADVRRRGASGRPQPLQGPHPGPSSPGLRGNRNRGVVRICYSSDRLAPARLVTDADI